MASLRCDSYCGIYCGACEVVNAETMEQKRKVIEMFETNIPGWKASPEQMKCSGCKTDDVFINCASCPIRPCAKSKGVEFCYQCKDYPCNIHEYIITASDQVPVLRHIKLNKANQDYIRENGLQAWLRDQEEKWKCPKCGFSYSWYSEQCSHCGCDLSSIKGF